MATKKDDSNDKDKTEVAPAVPPAEPVLQLDRNAAGHQVGETFTPEEANRLGISAFCRPFPGVTNSAVPPAQAVTR